MGLVELTKKMSSKLVIPSKARSWKLDKESPYYSKDRQFHKDKNIQHCTDLFDRFNYIMIIKIEEVENKELQEFRKFIFSEYKSVLIQLNDA